MSLNKAIAHGKEHRKVWYDSRAFDKACRNHGGCAWCEQNRLYKSRKLEAAMQYSEKEYFTNKAS